MERKRESHNLPQGAARPSHELVVKPDEYIPTYKNTEDNWDTLKQCTGAFKCSTIYSDIFFYLQNGHGSQQNMYTYIYIYIHNMGLVYKVCL